MSNFSSNVSNIGNRPQLVGMGSSTFNTQAMLQLEIDMLQMRKTPYLENIKKLETEKSAWNAFQNSLTNFNRLVSDLKDFDTSNQTVTFQSEGFVDATATSDAFSGNYDIEVTQLATAHRIMSEKIVGTIGVNQTVQINGKDLELTEDMTARDLALKINDGNYNVSAVVLDNQLLLTSNTEGSGNKINLSDSSFFEDIGLTSEGLIKNELSAATNAVYKINGVELESDSNTVKDIEGVTLTLRKETVGAIEFTVEKSAEELIGQTKKMIEGYNSLMKTVSTLNGEYGILQGEMLPRRVKMSLGNVFSITSINNQTLSSIGIGFDKFAGGGLIALDTEKLTDAFANDDSNVLALISGEDGMATKIFDIVQNYISENGLIQIEKDGLDERIDRFNKTIDRFDASFERHQESLLMKYARLDVMLAQLDMQKNYIDAQLGQFEMDSRRR